MGQEHSYHPSNAYYGFFIPTGASVSNILLANEGFQRTKGFKISSPAVITPGEEAVLWGSIFDDGSEMREVESEGSVISFTQNRIKTLIVNGYTALQLRLSTNATADYTYRIRFVEDLG